MPLDGGRRGDGDAPIGFPGCRRCPYLRRNRPDVCLACLETSAGQLPPPGLRRCSSCEQVLRVARPCPTSWCGRADRGWSVVFAAGVHAAGLRRAIVGYKYGGERWWAGVFARVLAGWLDRRAPWTDDFDAIVAMPAYIGSGARRQWDPVAEVVAALGELVGPAWQVETDLVRKVAETQPMSGTSRGDRVRIAEQELRAALVVPEPARVEGARLLVIDDVLAEGSTLREVALALRCAGAAEVAGLVLARPDWHGRSRPDAAAAITRRGGERAVGRRQPPPGTA